MAYVLSPAQREKKRQQDRDRRAANREALRAVDRERYRTHRERPPVSAERARELLDYDPQTGVLTYRVDRGPLKAGSVAGTSNRGYVQIVIEGRAYAGHRLAWVLVYGVWPGGEIDHIDGNPANNRIANLRDVTPTVNQQNKRAAPAGKKYSSLFGAQWCKQSGKWKASIRVNGRVRFLGFYPTDADASRAYIDAKRSLHEGCEI